MITRFENFGGKNGRQPKMIRVADYIIKRIYDAGVKHIFTLTGGTAMFLNDAIAVHENIKVICNHHEQASAMASVAYSKYTGGFSAACVTSGCGATNALTGLLEAWQDNVKCIFLSGQVNKPQTTKHFNLPLRQFGVQEADIVSIVKSITKYSIMVEDSNMIAYHLDRAMHLASTGRPGPVWIDVPLDIQGAFVDEASLIRYIPPKVNNDTCLDMTALKEYLDTSERPIILAGNGVKLAAAKREFREFIEKYNIPVVVTYLAVDLLPTEHPLLIGRVGIKGTRAGNFAIQNSDLLIAIGTKLSIPVIGYQYHSFARDAKKVVIDIDKEEHKKDTIKIDNFIHADAKVFLKNVIKDALKIKKFNKNYWWNKKCQHWKEQWPVCLPEYSEDSDGINLYYFIEELSKQNKSDSVVVSDAGSAYYVSSQALHIKDKQRYVTSGAQADMGFTLPGTIGVSVAKNNEEVIGITGDGSFQTNIQELQTIVHYNLPIKLFVWNNDGYLSIRTTQRKFFGDSAIGTDKESGVSFPEIKKIANAYGIKYVKILKTKELSKKISTVLKYDGPVICEVICQKWQKVVPTLGSMKTDDGKIVSKPFEDMYPFLKREEFYDNMIVEPKEE